MSKSPSKAQVNVRKHFASSILLWVRTDQPRQTGMDYWKGPHSKIISATPGLEEYRQIHLAEVNPGLWPATPGVETDRLPAHLLYTGLPTSSRWYEVAAPGAKVGARALIYLRRKDGVRAGNFRKVINNQLAPALAGTGVLRELRTQTFLPWYEKLWDTPNVAHDNPADQRFHASLILGFTDAQERAGFFRSREIESLSDTLAPLTSAIYAYDVSAALTYVKDGTILPHYQQ
jgi:hypothetical protein